jgi:hypothetical protein
MPIEEQLLQGIRAMEEQSTDCLRDLQEWQGRSEPFQRTLESSVQKLPNRISDEDDIAQQREYILNNRQESRSLLQQQFLPPTTLRPNLALHKTQPPKLFQPPTNWNDAFSKSNKYYLNSVKFLASKAKRAIARKCRGKCKS